MGYMGLDNWVESDNAFDFICSIEEAIAKLCEKEFEDEANQYNTS